MRTLREKNAALLRMDQLIRLEATGSPLDLAKKLNVSKPTIIRYIQVLKEDYQAPIRHCSYKNSYHYLHEFNLDLNKS